MKVHLPDRRRMLPGTLRRVKKLYDGSVRFKISVFGFSNNNLYLDFDSEEVERLIAELTNIGDKENGK